MMRPESIRLAPSVTTLALALVVMTACGGSPAATTPTETEAATFEPTTTPGVVATTPAPADTSASLDLGTDMPTTVDVTLSTGIYVGEFADGTFTSAGPASSCGYLLPNHFDFGFPHDLAHHDVEDVTFGAEGLLPATSVSSFGISVSIDSAAIGPHPLTAINPGTTAGETGNAQLSVVNGTRTLLVDAAGGGGVTIHLKAVCSPI